MIKHRIYARSEKRGMGNRQLITLIKNAIRTALEEQGIETACEIDVLLTDAEGIRSINAEMRDIGRATHVLSFPVFDFMPGKFKAEEDMIDPESGCLPLGDMVISIDAVYAQAEEFGHSIEREAAYLAVHSVLHLLGYDHLDEGKQKKEMREREEKIMEGMDLLR